VGLLAPPSNRETRQISAPWSAHPTRTFAGLLASAGGAAGPMALVGPDSVGLHWSFCWAPTRSRNSGPAPR